SLAVPLFLTSTSRPSPRSPLFPYTTLFRSHPLSHSMIFGPRIELKTPEELQLMHRAGHLTRQVLSAARSAAVAGATTAEVDAARSEEHTSELQSRFDLVCRLLLEKKKHNQI